MMLKLQALSLILAIFPIILLVLNATFSLAPKVSIASKWLIWRYTSSLAFALLMTVVTLKLTAIPETQTMMWSWLSTNHMQAYMACLVQLLGTVIGAFSGRYLTGEANQERYMFALSMVLACVHILLLANHWVLLIISWAAIGLFMQALLCFYENRPFAMLAAHKKAIADRIADALLVCAALVAWHQTGTAVFTTQLPMLVAQHDHLTLNLCAIAVVMAVIIRTALMPVHGWLIQVMEAPTPVSALLHAGVVNLSGFILIRFAPLLETSSIARWLLFVFGLLSALLAGLVLLTRVSIKVRLAWSTVAQMGFMVMECALGLYSFAAMHLIGHSIYKAHAFLSASSITQQSKLQKMWGNQLPNLGSMLLAPIAVFIPLHLLQTSWYGQAWAWWWTAILALAWAPLLWHPKADNHASGLAIAALLHGTGLILGLTAMMLLFHKLPLDIHDAPFHAAGLYASIGLCLLYLCLIAIHHLPKHMEILRRWSYAGFYLDEFYTRLTLKYWPIAWGRIKP